MICQSLSASAFCLLNCLVGAEEEAVGRNRDEEFKQEQSHEYIRPYAIRLHVVHTLNHLPFFSSNDPSNEHQIRLFLLSNFYQILVNNH